MRALLVLGLVAVLAALQSCVVHECTLLDCGPDALLDIDENITPASVEGATISVCQNERCASGVFGTPDDRAPVLDANGIHADVYFQLHEDSTISGLTIWVAVPSFARGDTYTVDVTMPNGVTATNHSWLIAGVTESEPNGSSCGPVCQNAQLQAE